MLTSRQKWRHQSIVGIRRKEHDLLYSQGLDNVTNRILPKSLSESSIGDAFLNSFNMSKKHATTGSLVETKNIVLMRSKVRFNPAIRVVLIPTVAEYRQAGLGDIMWWEDNNYKEFKLSAITELKMYMLQHPELDSKGAIKDMYQPRYGARSPSPPPPVKTKSMEGLQSQGNTPPARRVSKISMEKLADMDGLIFKSKAKNVNFVPGQSIFDQKTSESTNTDAGPTSVKDMMTAPLDPRGYLMAF